MRGNAYGFSGSGLSHVSLAQIFGVRATQCLVHATVPRSDNRTGIDFKPFQQSMYFSIGCIMNITIKVRLLKNCLQNQTVEKKILIFPYSTPHVAFQVPSSFACCFVDFFAFL